MTTSISSPNPPECDGVNKVRSSRPRVTIILGMLIAGGFLSALLSPFAASAQTGAPPVKKPAPAEEPPPVPTPPPATQPPTEQSQKAWHNAIVRVPLSKKGCFEAAYPSMEWRETPCTTPPKLPPPSPARGPRPYKVGAGNDYSAQVAPNYISFAVGFFDAVTNVDSVTSVGVKDAYSLQLNTNPFTTTSFPQCSHACQGWEQFVFQNYPGLGGIAFIQYWLIAYGNRCPTGWSYDGGISCYRFSSNGVSVPFQTIGSLGTLSLWGAVTESGDTDQVVLATATSAYGGNGDHVFTELPRVWQSAEFNIFGHSSGWTANFNYLSTIVVRTEVYASPYLNWPPSCVQSGTTIETSNLTLSTPCCVYPPRYAGDLPSIVFTESYPPRASVCSGGTSVPGQFSGGGDIALVTFAGLLGVWSLARLCRHRKRLQ